jgi:hypothetical protein
MVRILQELAGLAIATIGGLPLFEVLKTGSFLWRGDPERTTRQQDPVGYWGTVVATALLAVVALAVGVGVFFGVVKLHRL